ncbi:MAG TPA: ABC transporter substrate-binding protein [Anaerolineales bacterium]|nr:ABC transporter substrate-binding protein [Anaerolineales bacterium]
MRARDVLAIVVLGMMVLLPGWASGAPVSSRVPSNVLVIGTIISDTVSLDPAEAFERTSLWTNRQVYDTLVDFNRDLTRALPRLAESWTASADGKTYTFRLRRGAKFHSGNPVDAKAVEFSIRRVFRLSLAPAFIVTNFIRSPDDIVALGSDRVRITFKQAMPEVLMASVLENTVTGVVDPAVVQQNAVPDDPMANRWLSDHDAGSGPYQLIGLSRNLKIELKAFDDYWRGRARMGRVFVQEMPEATVQQLALQRGDIDVAIKLLPSQIKGFAGQSGYVVKTVPALLTRYLAMNTGYAPFANKSVRNAVKWAIDYDAIKRIFEDSVEVGQTIVPAKMFAHLADAPYRKNLDRARTLMREAGFERGFKVEMLVTLDPISPDIAAKMKEDLSQIGIDVDVKIFRMAELSTIYRAQQHQMVLTMWGADYPDPDNLAKAFADFDVHQLAWRNQWDHPVKKLVQQAVAELDRSKREALYKEIQKIVLDEGPYVVYAYPLRQYAMRANVKGLDPSPLYETHYLSGVFKE